MSTKRYYGWKPDRPDIRDFKLMAVHASKQFAPSLTLRPQAPAPVLDQLNLGCCGWNMMSYLIRYALKKQGLPDFNPARLVGYYGTRAIEGTISYDSGVQIRDCFKYLGAAGICDESLWPYDVSKFAVPPTPEALAAALKHVGLKYVRLDDPKVGPLDQAIKQCITDGWPFGFGVTLYPEFESDYVTRTGDVPMPSGDEAPVGGHAISGWGYDPHHVFCLNEWGGDWGDGGWFRLPWKYILSGLAQDFWTLREME